MEAPALARRRAEWELGGRRRLRGEAGICFFTPSQAWGKQESIPLKAHDELVETRTKLR